ncbi:MAG: TonB-dependent receptor [Alphaproteobacteria bacterium]
MRRMPHVPISGSSLLKSLSLSVPAMMFAAGMASAHMTGANFDAPPGASLSGTVTLPDGQQAAVIDSEQCEAQKTGDETCDAAYAHFFRTDAQLAAGTAVDYVITVDGQPRSGSATINPGGVLMIVASGARLDTVMVTAQKREQSAQSVPIALTAVGEFQLEKGTFRDLTDLNGLSANVRINADPTRSGGANITIRGISPTRTDDNSFDSPIGVMIDGVHLGTLSGQIIENFDIERIEILRGPQGTLFGKNTVGGVVHVIRTRPTGEWGAKVKLTGGSWGQFEARGVFNVPIIEDKLAMKAFFTHIESDGFLRNEFLDRRMPRRDYQNFGVTTLWTPTDKFEATLTVEKYQDESEGGGFLTNGNTRAADGFGLWLSCEFGAVPCRENRDQLAKSGSTDTPNPASFDVEAITLNMSYQFTDNLQLVSITAYRDMKEDRLLDFDGTSADFITIDRDNDYEQFSQEVRLEGSWDSSIGMINFVVGAHYWRSEFRQDWVTGGQFWDFIGLLNAPEAGGAYAFSSNVWFDPGLAASVWGELSPLEVCLIGGFGNTRCDSESDIANGLGKGLVQKLYEEQVTKSIAVFAQADWEFIPSWTLTVGVRWTEEKKDFIAGQAYLASLERVDVFNFPDFADLDNKWTDTSLKFGLSWQATDDILAYFTYAEGFHSGGFFGVNQNVADFERDQYDPEFAKTYEFGIKSQFLDNRVQANLALFYNDFKDKQEQSVQFDPSTNTVATVFSNVADAVYKGVELELTALVTENFTIFGSVGYLKASYKNFFTDVDPNDDCTGLPECIVNADFLTPRNAPEWVFGIGGSYVIPIGNGGEIELFVKYDWVDEVEGTLLNTPNSQGPSRENLQASISYRRDGYMLTFYGRNLTNDVQELFAQPIAPLFNAGTINAGASWGAELTAEF